MTEELNRFQRIKSLLQDTKLIDSHTISLVVAECDMALTQRPAAQATPEPVQLDVVRQAIEERDAMESRYHELAKSMTYKGNSVAWWHSKATAYRNAIDEVWSALKAAGIYADGAKTCADGVRELAATPEPVGEAPIWNSIQIASWIGSQLMHEPAMFERAAVCKFVRSLGRHPTLLKHSPKDHVPAPGVPEGWRDAFDLAAQMLTWGRDEGLTPEQVNEVDAHAKLMFAMLGVQAKGADK